MNNLLRSMYNREEWIDFLQARFLPNDFKLKKQTINIDFKSKHIKPQAYWIGDCSSLDDLAVLEISHTSENDPRIGVSRDAFRLMAELNLSRALFFFVSDNSSNFRFSLITLELKLQGTDVKYKFSNPKRFSFYLGEDAKIRTPESFLFKNGRIRDFEDLQSRFSIEVVNKEFYQEIQRMFYLLVGGRINHGSKVIDYEPMLKLPDTSDTKTRQEFGVRLIGRLVFCWFLKKKLSDKGNPLISDEVLSLAAVRDSYYHQVLEPLFFEVLNKPLKDRYADFRNQVYDNIPFLNGGLFDPTLHQDFYTSSTPTQQAKPAWNLKIPNQWFEDFFNILETYNFTIDENTSIDMDLSVDPEMLGRIFENLLAELNPETGETARKSTGSFYTPRPIVEYMVDESLIQYLKNKTDVSEPELRCLLDYNIEDCSLPKAQRIAIVDALDDIKVLDPACGSGAFPIGILQKMLLILQKVDPESIEWVVRQLDKIPNRLVRQALEDKLMSENWKYKHKMGIIQNAIYGVDIQPIATEISKLRLFLSLIVDESVIEANENKNINPLPNLSFKFVCANSLISLGVEKVTLVRFLNIIKGYDEIRERYLHAHTTNEKEQIKADFTLLNQSLLEQITQPTLKQGSILGEPEEQPQKSREEKAYLFKLLNWDPFQDKASDWFDPKWMFGIKNGFDIVIGNPPYIKEYTNRSAFDGLRESKYYQGKMDIWYLFACIGIDYLKDNGVLCFIATNNWTTSAGSSKMRDKVISETKIIKLIDFNNFKIFEAADIQTMIILFEKSNSTAKYELEHRRLNDDPCDFTDVLQLLRNEKSENNSILKHLFDRCEYLGNYILFNENHIDDLLKKMQTLGKFRLSNNEVAQGIVFPQDTLNKKNQMYLGENFTVGEGIFVLNHNELEKLNLRENELDLIRPLYTTSELHKYHGSNKNKYWVIYTTTEYSQPNRIALYPSLKKHLDKFSDIITSDNKPYGLHRSRNEHFFTGEKIISLRKCSAEPVFTYTDFECYVSATFYVIKPDNVNIMFLTAYLNSKLSAYWLRYRGKMQGSNYQIDKEPLINIPIPQIPIEQQRLFEVLVKRIIHTKEQGLDSRECEIQIDLMAYKLYQLSYSEAKLIDPDLDLVLASFGLSALDYERMSVVELSEMKVF